MKMISLVQWAADNKMSDRRARVIADEGRIKGATQIGRNWVVPEGAKRVVGRIKRKGKQS